MKAFLSRVRVEVELRGLAVHEAHLHPLPVAHVVPHRHVPTDAQRAHAEAQTGDGVNGGNFESSLLCQVG